MSRTMHADAFFGREGEIAIATELFASRVRLLTLSGPAGVGKTRLALELVERMRSGDGELFVCELAACVDEDDVVTTIARTLGLSRARVTTESLVAALEDRGPVLVVLDNAEHVTAPVAAVTGQWLLRCPETRCLVTSQWRLGVKEEHVLELGPLTFEEAEALWTARVRQLRPDYSPESEREPIGMLLRALDAIPLAIELAAARRHVLTAQAMFDRLAQGIDVLRTTDDRPERHRTLERAIEWSWSLLSPYEESLLAQCSVFETDFTLEALEGIAELEEGAPSVADVLQALREKSLVRLRDPTLLGYPRLKPRFSLYTAVREFAAARVPDRSDVLRRHAEWTVRNARSLAEAIGSTDGPPVHDELVRELSNLRAVVERSLREASVDRSLGARALICSYEALRWSGGAVSALSSLVRRFLAGEEVLPELAAELGEVRGAIAVLGGEFAAAEALLDEASTLGTGRCLPRILGQLAYVRHVRGGHYDRELLERALALSREHRYLREEAAILEMLGADAIGRGELPRARELIEGALRQYRAAGCEGVSGGALRFLAWLHLEEGRTSMAREVADRAREVSERIGSAFGFAWSTVLLADVEQDDAAFDCAIPLYESAIRSLRILGDRYMEGAAQAQLGMAYLGLGDRRRAASELERGADALRSAGDRPRAALYASALCAVRAELGEPVPQWDESAPVESNDLRDEARRLHEIRPSLNAEEGRAIGSSPRMVELAARSYEVRQALRLIEMRCAETERGQRTLTVGPECASIRVPSGQEIDLSNRPSLQQIVRFLIEAHETEPGRKVSVDALFAAGWPGERITGRSAANRVYVAIATLRKLGLEDVVLRTRDGYHLGEIRIVRSTDS